ncbi:MAG: hypothetical protein ACK4ZW_07305 [Blastomonas sp.]
MANTELQADSAHVTPIKPLSRRHIEKWLRPRGLAGPIGKKLRDDICWHITSQAYMQAMEETKLFPLTPEGARAAMDAIAALDINDQPNWPEDHPGVILSRHAIKFAAADLANLEGRA